MRGAEPRIASHIYLLHHPHKLRSLAVSIHHVRSIIPEVSAGMLAMYLNALILNFGRARKRCKVCKVCMNRKRKKKTPVADGFGRGESNPVLPATYFFTTSYEVWLCPYTTSDISIISQAVVIQVSAGMRIGVSDTAGFLNSNTHRRNLN
jgi:hypothetical protein